MTGLIVVTGHPATGKTTIAEHLARELRLPVVIKDAIKEKLWDNIGAGDRAWSQRLGKAAVMELFRDIEAILDADVSVVAEANFSPEEAAPVLAGVAGRAGATVVQVVVAADEPVLRSRFEERACGEDRHACHLDAVVLAEVATGGWSTPMKMELPGELIEVDTTGGDWDTILADVTRDVRTHLS